GPQLGHVLVGEPRLFEHFRRAPALAEDGEHREIGAGIVCGNRIAQWSVVAEEVDVLIGRRLVEYVAGVEPDGRGHGRPSFARHASIKSPRPAGRTTLENS